MARIEPETVILATVEGSTVGYMPKKFSTRYKAILSDLRIKGETAGN